MEIKKCAYCGAENNDFNAISCEFLSQNVNEAVNKYTEIKVGNNVVPSKVTCQSCAIHINHAFLTMNKCNILYKKFYQKNVQKNDATHTPVKSKGDTTPKDNEGGRDANGYLKNKKYVATVLSRDDEINKSYVVDEEDECDQYSEGSNVLSCDSANDPTDFIMSDKPVILEKQPTFTKREKTSSAVVRSRPLARNEFKCTDCPFLNKTIKGMQRHMLEVHKVEKPRIFVCEQCPNKYAMKKSLINHCRKVHGDSNPPKPSLEEKKKKRDSPNAKDILDITKRSQNGELSESVHNESNAKRTATIMKSKVSSPTKKERQNTTDVTNGDISIINTKDDDVYQNERRQLFSTPASTPSISKDISLGADFITDEPLAQSTQQIDQQNESTILVPSTQNKSKNTFFFKCFKCTQDFYSGSKYENHLKEVHEIKDPRIFKCHLCETSYKRNYNLQVHISKAHKSPSTEQKIKNGSIYKFFTTKDDVVQENEKKTHLEQVKGKQMQFTDDSVLNEDSLSDTADHEISQSQELLKDSQTETREEPNYISSKKHERTKQENENGDGDVSEIEASTSFKNKTQTDNTELGRILTSNKENINNSDKNTSLVTGLVAPKPKPKRRKTIADDEKSSFIQLETSQNFDDTQDIKENESLNETTKTNKKEKRKHRSLVSESDVSLQHGRINVTLDKLEETSRKSKKKKMLDSNKSANELNNSSQAEKTVLHCLKCHKSVKDEAKLEQHMKKNHRKPIARKFHCVNCAANFSSDEAFLKHTTNQMCSKTLYQCDLENCKKRFESRKYLKLHIKRKHSIRNYTSDDSD